MAKKKTIVRNQDQFLVRLPDGLRDRIKAGADREGMSMNEAIVWVLAQAFPAPSTIEGKLEELATMAAMLKSGGDIYPAVDRLVDEIHEALADISKGNIETPPDFKSKVSARLERWEEQEIEYAQDSQWAPFSESTASRPLPKQEGEADQEEDST
jgi:hypothetical protein